MDNESNFTSTYTGESTEGKQRYTRSIALQNDVDQSEQKFDLGPNESLVNAREGSVMAAEDVAQGDVEQNVKQTAHQQLNPQTFYNKQETKQEFMQNPLPGGGYRAPFIPTARSFLPFISSRPHISHRSSKYYDKSPVKQGKFDDPSFSRVYDTNSGKGPSRTYNYPDEQSSGFQPLRYQSSDEKAMMQIFKQLKSDTKRKSSDFAHHRSLLGASETGSTTNHDIYSYDGTPEGKSINQKVMDHYTDLYPSKSGFSSYGEPSKHDYSNSRYSNDFGDMGGESSFGATDTMDKTSYDSPDYNTYRNFKNADYDSSREKAFERDGGESFYSAPKNTYGSNPQERSASTNSYNTYGGLPEYTSYDDNKVYESKPSGYNYDKKQSYSDRSNSYYDNDHQHVPHDHSREESPPPTTTPTPIWIHPFARGGSAFPKNTESQTDYTDDTYGKGADATYRKSIPERGQRSSTYDNYDDSYYKGGEPERGNSANSYGNTDDHYDYSRSPTYSNPTKIRRPYGSTIRKYPNSEYAGNTYTANDNNPRSQRDYYPNRNSRYSSNTHDRTSYSESDNSYSDTQYQNREVNSDRYQPVNDRNDGGYNSYPKTQREYKDSYDNPREYRPENKKGTDKRKAYSEEDPYTDPKNREKSNKPSDPDSYYNAKNPGPWGAPPPFPTDTRGQGGTLVRQPGGGEGDGYAGEGPEGEHEHRGRKPPDFGTFPFNFMPKHLTGPLFTQQGEESFKDHANFGHVAKLSLDENGEVQYDYSENRVAPDSKEKAGAKQGVEGKRLKINSNEEDGKAASESTDHDDINRGNNETNSIPPTTTSEGISSTSGISPKFKLLTENVSNHVPEPKNLKDEIKLLDEDVQNRTTIGTGTSRLVSESPPPKTTPISPLEKEEVSHLDNSQHKGEETTTLKPSMVTGNTLLESKHFRGFLSSKLDEISKPNDLVDAPPSENSDEELIVASVHPVKSQDEFVRATDIGNGYQFPDNTKGRAKRSADFFDRGDSFAAFANDHFHQKGTEGSLSPFSLNHYGTLEHYDGMKTLGSNEEFRVPEERSFSSAHQSDLDFPAPPKEYELFMLGQLPNTYKSQKQMFLETIHLDGNSDRTEPLSGSDARDTSAFFDNPFKDLKFKNPEYKTKFDSNWPELDSSINTLYGKGVGDRDETKHPFGESESAVVGKDFQSSKWNSHSSWI